MKITKKQLFASLISIAIILASLAIMICDFVDVFDLWTHPILTFIFSLSVGFYLFNLIIGIVNKSAPHLFLSTICACYAIIYPFAHYDFWWIGLVVLFVIWAITGIFSFMLMGSNTEGIALNASPDYKDYKQRTAEKKEAEEACKEELPEIKSFK